MYAPVEGDRELKLEVDRCEELLVLNSSPPVLEKQTHHYYIVINFQKLLDQTLVTDWFIYRNQQTGECVITQVGAVYRNLLLEL